MASRKGGFASMAPERRREIARKGGLAAHSMGLAHEFTPETARIAGSKGGQRSAELRAKRLSDRLRLVGQLPLFAEDGRTETSIHEPDEYGQEPSDP